MSLYISYSMAIFGGILVGYAIIPMIYKTESRLPRVALALTTALLAFTGQLFTFAVMNPGIVVAADWFNLSRTWYPLVIIVVSLVIGLYELGLIVNSRFALIP